MKFMLAYSSCECKYFLTFCYENPTSAPPLHFHNKCQKFVSLRQKERKETLKNAIIPSGLSVLRQRLIQLHQFRDALAFAGTGGVSLDKTVSVHDGAVVVLMSL